MTISTEDMKNVQTENWFSKFKELGVKLGCIGSIHTLGTSRNDNCSEISQLIGKSIEWQNVALNIEFTYSSVDYFAVLGTGVQDGNRTFAHFMESSGIPPIPPKKSIMGKIRHRRAPK
jgi:hypothetical protein